MAVDFFASSNILFVNMSKFEISPEDCLITLEFRDSASLREVATRLNCDPSALVRKVQRIASEHGLLEKVKGRWVLTAKGHLLNRWTEDSLVSQKRLLESKPQMRIGTTMWLSEQVIVPYYQALHQATEAHYNWIVTTPHRSFETELIEGTCDFVIACGAPVDPLISYKRILPEEFILIAPKSWQKEFKKIEEQERFEKLLTKPFVRHSDMNPQEFLNLPEQITNISLTVDNIIGIRSAVSKGHGWSVVPRLAVLNELEADELIEIPYGKLKVLTQNHLSLWWLRSRKEPQQLVGKMQQWLLHSLAGIK
ncbi:hypothetical protein DOE51_16880 [Bdellovibrio sp. NC01]|nr:hypothetical protein DOE51_16880 [Bdellovibrio sp. NC01]